ncbi:hypothetical protein U1Q18_039729, partial [Sarracenia purpurea var. burkii]
MLRDKSLDEKLMNLFRSTKTALEVDFHDFRNCPIPLIPEKLAIIEARIQGMKGLTPIKVIELITEKGFSPEKLKPEVKVSSVGKEDEAQVFDDLPLSEKMISEAAELGAEKDEEELDVESEETEGNEDEEAGIVEDLAFEDVCKTGLSAPTEVIDDHGAVKHGDENVKEEDSEVEDDLAIEEDGKIEKEDKDSVKAPVMASPRKQGIPNYVFGQVSDVLRCSVDTNAGKEGDYVRSKMVYGGPSKKGGDSPVPSRNAHK